MSEALDLIPPIVQSLLGLCVFMGLAWLFGLRERAGAPTPDEPGRSLVPTRHAPWRVALVGILLQFAIAALILEVGPIRAAFSMLNAVVLGLQEATEAGTSFLFGYLGGAPLPFETSQPGASFVLALRALPLMILVSALAALLTWWRVLPFIVRLFSLLLERSLGVSGAVGLGSAANVFMGMTEAPLFVRPYLARMSRSELFVLMVAGMATVAGTVLVLYANILRSVLPDAAGHLLTASLISAPAAIAIALLMVPARSDDVSDPDAAVADRNMDGGAIGLPDGTRVHGSMDALVQGTRSGLALYLNVVAMLFVFVALVSLVNALLGALPELAGAPISLERLLGWLMSPLCWLMGVPWAEADVAGSLLGTKTVLNELLAYLQLSALPAGELSPRSTLIMSYALCGFANLGSLGILIGGLASMVPERREDIVGLGWRSLIGGTLATCCTGSVIAVLSV